MGIYFATCNISEPPSLFVAIKPGFHRRRKFKHEYKQLFFFDLKTALTHVLAQDQTCGKVWMIFFELCLCLRQISFSLGSSQFYIACVCACVDSETRLKVLLFKLIC